LCYLGPDDLAFLLSETHINTEEALKEHLIDVQAKAFKVHPYPSIRNFSFARPRISRLPAYHSVLKLGRERNNAILVDIGCCFGDCTRKIVADGFPITGVLGFDIEKDFWDFGHEIFKSIPETFPAAFVKGDIFDSSTLELTPPLYDAPATPKPTLSSLTSLNPLHGHVSVVYAGGFFHMFNYDRQLQVARILAGLISPEPGSIIFGTHLGQPVKGFQRHSDGSSSYYQSPESWKEMWDGDVFENGKVKVEVSLRILDPETPELQGKFGCDKWLEWSVLRL